MLFTPKALPSTSAAIFIVVSVACMAASSSPEMCSMIPRPPSCDCSNTPDGYELRCSAFTVQVSPKAVVHIQCENNVVSDFSVLSGTYIGEVDTLIIRLCPLPTVSLNQLMQNMGVSSVNNLQLTFTGVNGNSEMTVTRELFHGLSKLTSFTLHTNGTTILTDDVFTDMHNLKFINLQSNKLFLGRDIFCGVTKLQVLKLRSYNQDFLVPGIFYNLIDLQILVLSGKTINLSRSVFSDIKNLMSLVISSTKINNLPSDLFVDLTELWNINLYANEFIRLPQKLFMNNSELETVKIQDNRRTLKTLPPRMLADLAELKIVTISNCNMSTLPEDLLWGSASIHTISLNNNAFITLPETLFRDCEELQSLDISYNRITDLPNQIFSNVKNLKYLKINNNQLSVITNQLFESLRNLMVLDLKDNRLTHVETRVFKTLRFLKAVNMSNNMLTFENASKKGTSGVSPLHYCRLLVNIQLENNTLNKVFPDWLKLQNLETLNLAYNKISQIKFEDLLFDSFKDISVNVSYNNISEIDIFYEWDNIYETYNITEMVNIEPLRTELQHYGTLMIGRDIQFRHIFVEGNFIKCDCKIPRFSRVHIPDIFEIVMETNPENLQCAKRGVYREFLLEYLKPKYVSCFLKKEDSLNCPEECTCQLMSSNKTLLVNCNQNNITSTTTRDNILSRAVFSVTNNLQILEIDSVKMHSLPSNLLLDLINLNYITLYRNEFLSLPQNLFVNNQHLFAVNIVDNRRTLSTLPPGLLGNLFQLRQFTLRSCNTSTLPEDLLWGSKAILLISLYGNVFSTLPKMLFRHCIALETLDISHNRITHLPIGLFKVTDHLQTLKINNNQLTVIPNGLFSSLKYLRVLDLKDNRLTHIESKAFINLELLCTLDMSNNLIMFRDNSLTGRKSTFKFLIMLNNLQLANNSVTKILFDWTQFKELETLNLSYNKISQIKDKDLHFNGSKNTFVNISYNNISDIDIFDNKRVYKYVSETAVYNVTVRHYFIEGNPINCDCKVYRFLQYNGENITSEIKITTETNTSSLQCVKLEAYTGQVLQKVPIKYFTCLLRAERRPSCPEACSCIFIPTSKTMVIECQQTNSVSTQNVTHNLTRDIFSNADNLVSLEIKWNRMTSLTPNLFVDLINLRKISMYANKFESLPQNLFVNNTNLEKINIEDNGVALRTLPSRLLAGLTRLKDVKLNGCNMSNLPEDLLWGSTSINTISLKNNALTTLPEQLLIDCSELQTLDISFNSITDLPSDLFSATRNLKTLKINNNQLSIIRNYLFFYLNNLEILDLKWNTLTNIQEQYFGNLSSLTAVDMSNNMLTFANSSSRLLFERCPNLKDIQLQNNSVTTIYFEWRYMYNLQTLNLAYNKISHLMADDILFSSRKNTFVNVSYNYITKIDIFEDNKFRTTRIHDVPTRYFFIEGNPIYCDGKTYSLSQYFYEAVSSEVKFTIGTKLSKFECVNTQRYMEHQDNKIHIKYFDCLYKKGYSLKCPEKCKCLFRTSDLSLKVDCQEKNLTSIPEVLPDIKFLNYTELNLCGNIIKSVRIPLGPGYEKVAKFFLSDNMISEIDLTTFSPKLQVLKLDGNRVNQFNKSSMDFLINCTSLTQLTLHNNPWRCDCTSKDFVNLIQNIHNLRKIQILNKVMCENGKEILKISHTELCPAELQIAVYVSYTVAALALLIGFLLGFYYKFKNEIKIWLYAHRCCLWFVTEEQLDQDKSYDAFVSYAYQDEDFVLDDLVPRLEDERYTLCLHQRDWIPGEIIPEQIVRSVESSRRTLIILSPAFLESVWGNMEFRVAHQQAMRDGRVRVIVVLYGDIDPTVTLNSELQAYLTMNTYVKWGDTYFWEKLRFAMPHSSKHLTMIPLHERT